MLTPRALSSKRLLLALAGLSALTLTACFPPPPVAIEDLAADPDLSESFRVRVAGIRSSLCVVVPAAEQPARHAAQPGGHAELGHRLGVL